MIKYNLVMFLFPEDTTQYIWDVLKYKENPASLTDLSHCSFITFLPEVDWVAASCRSSNLPVVNKNGAVDQIEAVGYIFTYC